MNPRPPNSELRSLIDRALDGSPLDKMMTARLETLLEDDDALDYYLSVTRQEAMIPHALSGMASVGPVSPFIRKFPIGKLSRIAALLMLGIGLGLTGNLAFKSIFAEKNKITARDEPASPICLTGLVGVEWENGYQPRQASGGQAPERLFFRTGLVELTYASGVRMTIEGPADLDITGPESVHVTKGRMVTSVPKGAEGFAIHYNGGKVIDLGTEFAFSTGLGEATELGVFDGLVELHRPDSDVLSLMANQALQIPDRISGNDVSTIPLDREKFVRRIPTRDFRWHVKSHDPHEVEFDVSHLVWKSGEYLAIFKWMQGANTIHVRDVALLLDGVPVAESHALGSTGWLQAVRDNIFRLNVPSSAFQRGRWTLRASLSTTIERERPILEQKHPVNSVGIMQFEEGLVTQATAKDFIGTWRYYHNGRRFERTFHPDGSLTLTINDNPSTGPLSKQRWSIENGKLIIPVRVGQKEAHEIHLLRDAETLIFASNPYENAKKIPTK